MTNKKFFAGILAMALVFTMALVACDSDSGVDTWSDVTSLSQVNGTWKSPPQTETRTEQGITFKSVIEVTLIVNASASTISGSGTETITCSGSNLDTYWAALKANAIASGYTVNDSKKSFTKTNTATERITVSYFNGAQINSKNNKLKILVNGTEIIYTKQ